MRQHQLKVIDDFEAATYQVQHFKRLIVACRLMGLVLHVSAGAVKVESEGRFRGLDADQQRRVINGWNPFAPKVPRPQ